MISGDFPCIFHGAPEVLWPLKGTLTSLFAFQQPTSTLLALTPPPSPCPGFGLSWRGGASLESQDISGTVYLQSLIIRGQGATFHVHRYDIQPWLFTIALNIQLDTYFSDHMILFIFVLCFHQ